MGERKTGLIGHQTLQRCHRFGDFALVFERFGGCVPVVGTGHGGNLLGGKWRADAV
jgi:hypothetical protein